MGNHRLGRGHGRWGPSAILLVISLLGSPQRVEAGPARADVALRDWHAGVNLRTDFGTHPLRLGGGVRFDRLDAILVLDPMVLADGQHDLDLLAEYLFGPGGWSLMGGWRASSISLDGGHQWQQKLVLGAAAGLPAFGRGRIRGRVGFELTTLLVKHGGGLDTDWISLGTRRRGGLEDRLHLGLFVRFEYAAGF